ncbi:Pyridine nucleotide-disulfide oxidoreductase dimerization [Penicillium manginii]|uniref:Pyridine nucleotide-disulfide oxidoreductase dimerization n=1 Tax=Penicillium manginii TaxID=203109 RepID=UPI0025469F26|nr:Pyridine nucleotide-disulfide oxidoreductase dimerization [Penicillium manginii]KAJ5761406.1 Pyridine nucleotide-disulfide oxidoreductase dimerization [Penicillium manginii]
MPHFKLKDLPTLKNIPQKLEVDVEGVDDGKVLLVKTGNTVHALSPRCTHYGAPLKGGVIEGERLTCPWHGACFNITTGDVEDAPALNALNKYEIIEKDDGVYIEAEESDIKSGHRDPALKCSVSSDSDERVLIVGGGTIGLIQSLLTKKYRGKITILTKEPANLIIDRPKLSKALIPDPDKIALRPKQWYKDAGVEILSEEVTSVDFDAKTVTTSSSKHTYTKLVLATGGIPKTLPLPGFDSVKNIFTLRTVADVKSILDALTTLKTDNKAPKKVVIIGSSFIGMEIGNALAQDTANAVTIIGMESAPMERVMGAEVGRIFQRNLEKAGIRFILNASVEKASTPSASTSTSVHLGDGSVIPADIVILGVGVRPATDFLKGNERISLEGDGSVRTDEHFAVPGLDGVFAIGDIARFPYHGPGGDGSLTRIEHWNVAQNAGRSVARSILHAGGGGGGVGDQLEAEYTDFLVCGGGVRCGMRGIRLMGMMMCLSRRKRGSLLRIILGGEIVVAVATMGVDPVMVKVAALMRVGRMAGKKEVVSGIDVLGLE